MKYYLVDFDDTLIWTYYGNFAAYEHAIRDVLNKEIMFTTEKITHNCLQNIVSMSFNSQMTDDTLPTELENTLIQYDIKFIKNDIKAIKDKYYEHYLYLTQPNNYLINLFKQLNQYNIILVTNGIQERVIKTLSYHIIPSLFESKFFNENLDNNSKYFNAMHRVSEVFNKKLNMTMYLFLKMKILKLLKQ